MSEIVVRNKTIDDIDACVRLGSVVQRSAYRDIFPPETFDKRDADMHTRIQQRKADRLNGTNEWGSNSAMVEYVAVSDGKVVGYVRGLVESTCQRYRDKKYAEVKAIFVDQEYQKLGVGKKLFDEIANKFKEKGCKRMVIGVLKENLSAHKIYPKWGCKLDDYQDEFQMMGYRVPQVYYIYDL